MLIRYLSNLDIKWITLAALILCSGTLSIQLTTDDYIHAAMIQDTTSSYAVDSPTALFTFLDGKRETNQRMMDEGILPWWTSGNFKLNFFRPIASVSHWLDYTLLGSHYWLMHLHSIAWYLLSIYLLYRFYTQLIPNAKLAKLATLLFAISESHGVPVGWLANRNILIASCFGLSCLLVYHHWLKTQKYPWLLLALTLFLCAILSAEAAVSFIFYLGLVTFLYDRPAWWTWLRRCMPFAITLVVWQLYYSLNGFGASGSAIYVNPITEPERFLALLPQKLSTMFWAQYLGFPTSIASPLLGQLSSWQLALFALASANILYRLYRFLLNRDRGIAMWFLTSVMAIVPVCAGNTEIRNLYLVGIGAYPVIAFLIAKGLLPQAIAKGPRYVAIFFAAIHIGLACLLFPVEALKMDFFSRPLTENTNLEKAAGNLDAQSKVFLINPPVAFLSTYLSSIHFIKGIDNPQYIRSLSSGLQQIRLQRSDDYSLQLTLSKGIGNSLFDDIFRDPRATFSSGDSVTLSDMRVEILQIDGTGHPTSVKFVFDSALESAQLKFLVWRGMGYQRLDMSELTSLELEPVNVLKIVSNAN